MPAYKDPVKETWYASFYYEDWKGIKKKKMKRGFPNQEGCPGLGAGVSGPEVSGCKHGV